MISSFGKQNELDLPSFCAPNAKPNPLSNLPSPYLGDGFGFLFFNMKQRTHLHDFSISDTESHIMGLKNPCALAMNTWI